MSRKPGRSSRGGSTVTASNLTPPDLTRPHPSHWDELTRVIYGCRVLRACCLRVTVTWWRLLRCSRATFNVVHRQRNVDLLFRDQTHIWGDLAFMIYFTWWWWNPWGNSVYHPKTNWASNFPFDPSTTIFKLISNYIFIMLQLHLWLQNWVCSVVAEMLRREYIMFKLQSFWRLFKSPFGLVKPRIYRWIYEFNIRMLIKQSIYIINNDDLCLDKLLIKVIAFPLKPV